MYGNPLKSVDPFGLAAIEIPIPDEVVDWFPDWAVNVGRRLAFWLTILTIPGDTPQKDCDDDCDLELDQAATEFSKKTPGPAYACVYRKKGVIFTFPQWKGKGCYPINKELCMVDTSTLDPALYGKK